MKSQRSHTRFLICENSLLKTKKVIYVKIYKKEKFHLFSKLELSLKQIYLKLRFQKKGSIYS
jgi:hypothetical protein